MSEIKTNNTEVQLITSSFDQNISNLELDHAHHISYSNGQAMLDFDETVSSLTQILDTFKVASKTDVNNLRNIHKSIEEMDISLRNRIEQ